MPFKNLSNCWNIFRACKPKQKDEICLNGNGLKTYKIRQSAAKPRIEERSETRRQELIIRFIITIFGKLKFTKGSLMNKKGIKEYRAWKAMKSRCYSPSATKGYYKKNGIEVCRRWKNSYKNFVADMGYAPSNEYTMERIDNSKDYEPNNCKWATRSEQSKNRGSFNKVFTYQGESMVLKDWARKFNIKYTTLYMRLYRSGYSFEEAIQSIKV